MTKMTKTASTTATTKKTATEALGGGGGRRLVPAGAITPESTKDVRGVSGRPMHVVGDIVRSGEEIGKARTFLPLHIRIVHRLILRRRSRGWK